MKFAWYGKFLSSQSTCGRVGRQISVVLEEPLRGPLENRHVPGDLGELRNELDARAAGADDGDPLVAELDRSGHRAVWNDGPRKSAMPAMVGR